jgi:predicted phage-related endonuclease
MENMFSLDLYPVVGSRTVAGLPLSASFDGLTMDNELVWEHKSFNVALAQSLDMGFIPDQYLPQLEQQLLVSGAPTLLFSCSSLDGHSPRFTWYHSNADLRARLIDGWRVFADDLAAWHAPAPAVITPTGATPDSLPALHIAISGQVTASNIADFKSRALVVLGQVNRTLFTDQKFADAEKAVKWCADVESRLAAAKQHALSQTADIDELYRTIDDISAATRTVRLDLDKLIKARKDEIRTTIVLAAKVTLAEHIAALNATLPPAVRLPAPTVDFAACIKGKSNLDSMRAAVDTALASARFDVSQCALRYNVNVASVMAADHDFLFADMGHLAAKDPDDLRAIIAQRVAAHAAAVQLRADQLAAASASAAIEDARKAKSMPVDLLNAVAELVEYCAPPALTGSVSPVSVPAFDLAPADPLSPPTLRIGQICDRLGFAVQADFLARLGFVPATTAKAAKFYHESDFVAMCNALAAHIVAVGHTSKGV